MALLLRTRSGGFFFENFLIKFSFQRQKNSTGTTEKTTYMTLFDFLLSVAPQQSQIFSLSGFDSHHGFKKCQSKQDTVNGFSRSTHVHNVGGNRNLSQKKGLPTVRRLSPAP